MTVNTGNRLALECVRLFQQGGVIVKEESLGTLERHLNDICHDEFHFPLGEVFKWSPRKNQWMYKNLVEDDRLKFFRRVLTTAHQCGVKALVAISDKNCLCATRAPTHELDVIAMLLERFDSNLPSTDPGLVIVAEPSGGRVDHRQFLADCMKTLSDGTDYVRFNHIPINVLTTPFNNVRILQLADLVTSCTTALVAGNVDFAAPVFESIRPLLLSDGIRIGGIGLKIHPDTRYVNLHYWLVGDELHMRANIGTTLPYKDRLYANDPMIQ